MRLFIASPVTLDDYEAVKKDFEGIFEGKWTKEENLHLTWIFLGETEHKTPILNKLKILTPLESEVQISKLGYFGRPPKVFYAKAESEVLYSKAREFKEAGFKLYRFKPHITLCRIKVIHDYKAYKEMMKSYREKMLGKILPQIDLYKSTLTQKGAYYEKLV